MTLTLLPGHGSNRSSRAPRIALFVLALTLSTLGIFMIGIDVGVGLRPAAGRGGVPLVSAEVDRVESTDRTPMISPTIRAPRTKIISEVGGTSLSADQPVREVSDENMAEAFGNGECGVSVFRAIGLQVTVEAAEVEAEGEQRTHQSPPTTRSFIVTSSLPGRDLQLAGRAFSLAGNAPSSSLSSDSEPDLLVLSPSITRLSVTQWRATFGPCYADDDDGDYKEITSGKHVGPEESEVRKQTSTKIRTFDFDIIATWLGTKFLGQKWRLPDRNDSPPFATMKKKCLDLRLEGDCEQYGLTLATSSGAVHSQAHVKKTSSSLPPHMAIREGNVSTSSSSVLPPISLKCLPRQTVAPLCSAVNTRGTQVDAANTADESPLFGNGQWRSIGIPDGVLPEFDDGTRDEPHLDPFSSLAPLNTTSHMWPHVKAVLDDPVGLNRFFVIKNASFHNSSTYYSLASGPRVVGEAGEEAVASTAVRSLVMAWEPPCRMHSQSMSESGNNPIGSSPQESHQSPGRSFLGRHTAKQVAAAMHKYFGNKEEEGAKRDSHSPPPPHLYTIALFGDSMMVEQFHVWCHLLHGEDCGKHVRQGKSRSLRWMNIEKTFNISDTPRMEGEGKSEAVEASYCLVTLRVRFARSYTTKGGHSVIAPIATIVQQLLSVDPDIVAGNLASLHWQQNRRTQRDWEENLENFAYAVSASGGNRKKMNGAGALLRYPDSGDETREDKKKRQRRRERLFFYWGNTMIQMGRTQGLNSGRTNAFNEAARRLLGGGAGLNSHSTPSPSAVADLPHRRSRAVTYFNPYHVSVARRESSFDGQHWACYHRFGGVSASITQLWIAYLLESSLRGVA